MSKPEASAPPVSVVVVNYNGKRFLLDCVKSVAQTDYPAFEVVVVDNGSTDDSLDALRAMRVDLGRRLKIVSLGANMGPARARNEGARAASGEYLAFLDNDTVVEPAWMRAAINALDRDDSVGAVQCKLLFRDEPDKLDCAGEYIAPNGFLVQRAAYKEIDNGQYDSPDRLLAAKSAGMFIRADVFRRIDGFDEDYFIYMEETDLCWRAWLAGYETVFCAGSVVYHVFSSTRDIVDSDTNNYLIRFHGTKNYAMTLIKNMGAAQLMSTLPRHVAIWMGLAMYLLLRGNARSAWNITRGVGWNVVRLPATMHKRRRIQGSRVLPDRALLDIVMRRGGFLEKTRQAMLSQKLEKTPENI